MNGKYDDIIHLPHHTSTTRPRMSRIARAAQFAPFAALTGLDDEMEEKARITDKKIELDECEKEIINRELIYIRDNLPINVTVTYFLPDSTKIGGAYVTQRHVIKKIAELSRQLITDERSVIPIDDILQIEING